MVPGGGDRAAALTGDPGSHSVYPSLHQMNGPLQTDSDRVRVLINGLHAKSGGGVTYLRNVLPHLAEDGRFDLHLLLHRDQVPLFETIGNSIARRIVDLPASLVYQMLWEQIALPFLARELAVEVTFSPANFGPLFARTPVIMLRNAVAVGNREPRISKRIYWKTVALLTAASLGTSHRAIAVSQYARDSLSFSRRNRRNRKVEIVYHGVNPLFTPGRKSENAEPFLLVVSDIYIQKNLETLIEALPIVHHRFPEMQVRIAGRRIDDFYYDGLVQAVTRMKLGDKLVFLGQKTENELLRLYRDCAVFVLPSTMETFGNPLVEAMACGAPVACSNVAAMPEIVGDGALLFDPLDAEDMAKKILRILENPKFARDLAAKGFERSKLFSWKQTAQKTGDILIDAAIGRLGNKRPRGGRENTSLPKSL